VVEPRPARAAAWCGFIPIDRVHVFPPAAARQPGRESGSAQAHLERGKKCTCEISVLKGCSLLPHSVRSPKDRYRVSEPGLLGRALCCVALSGFPLKARRGTARAVASLLPHLPFRQGSARYRCHAGFKSSGQYLNIPTILRFTAKARRGKRDCNPAAIDSLSHSRRRIVGGTAAAIR